MKDLECLSESSYGDEEDDTLLLLGSAASDSCDMEFPTRTTISSTASLMKKGKDDKMQVEELRKSNAGGSSKRMLNKAQKEIEK